MYEDRHGIAFAAYRHHLPGPVSAWEQVRRVRDPYVIAAIHYQWQRCQVCGADRHERVKLEAHHIIGGTKGRSDERTNLIMLCAGGAKTCHERVNTAELPLATILWALWRTNRLAVDWVRLALLRRRHLPDLLPNPRFQALYNVRAGVGRWK